MATRISPPQNKTYYINPAYLTFVENSGYGANLIQVSASSSCYISVFDPSNGIGYNDADRNYRRWKVTAYNNKFPSNDKFYIYVRLERNSTSALVIYDKVLRGVKGGEVTVSKDEDGNDVYTEAETSQTDYYYIRIGEVGATNGTTIREITYDTGYLESDQGKEESNDLNEMWGLDKYTTPWLIKAKQWLSSFTVKGFITLVGGLVFRKGEIEKPITDIKRSTDSDKDVPINDETVPTTKYLESVTNERFLRKDKDDRTPYKLNVGDKLTAEKGIQIGQMFVPGILTGLGGYFDEYANGEVESLIIRRFLEVPELRFNRVQVTLGDKWNAPGAGVIERVVPDSDTTGTIFLKLEEGEYGAVAVGDICMGIFHSETTSENATADEEITDEANKTLVGFTFAGFYTCYFTITEITGKNNGQFKYQMRPTSGRWKISYHPRSSMHFVCYGSFTDPQRQTSAYTTRTYTRLLKNQNGYEITEANLAMQYGDMTNMSLYGIDMAGYSIYLNNVYFTGILKQVNASGEEVKTANDKGAWVSGTTYSYYDRVSHKGSLWLCVNPDGTNSEPMKGNSDWLLQVASGDSLVVGGRFSSAKTPYMPNSIVDFADKIWSSTDTVDYAPYGIYTDASGNRFQFSDGGFCLVDDSEVQSGWSLFVDLSDVKDGEDGQSLTVQYSSDGKNWHDTFTDGDIYMRQKLGEDGAWSDKIRIVGEAGAAGKNGEYTEYEFAVNEDINTPPTSGWQDAPPTIGIGQYLWMRMRVVQGDGTVGNWSTPVRLKGEKGDSVEFVGRFVSGVEVPYLGVVNMGDANWVAKVKTSNPPLWCWTDASGNRFQYSDGGFCLTGEENTEEYELLVSNGKDGADGTDYEFIFFNTTEGIRPETPSTNQVDDYIPSGWHDDPVGVSESVQYEWMSMRRKKNGLWGNYSMPSLWAKFGEDGTNYEFVYTRTKTESRPNTPSSKQQDDYIPTGWTDDPVEP